MRLLAASPDRANNLLASDMHFYYWVIVNGIKATDEYKLMAALVRYQDTKLRHATLMVAVHALIAGITTPPMRMHAMVTEQHVLCDGEHHCRFCRNQ
jgi:hypothetical protein